MRSFLPLAIGISYILTIAQCQGSEQTWKKKEKSVSMLELAKESITKANDHLTILAYWNKISSHCESSGCEDIKKTLFYLEVASTLISTVKETFQKGAEVKYELPKENTIDCTEVLEDGNTRSGVYNIWPRNLSSNFSPISVYCDMDTDGGGWTVVQRRGNYRPQEDFYRNWTDYKIGFGNLNNDFWLGNDNLHFLSSQKRHKIRFDLESKRGEKRYALYKTFLVEDEIAKFKLHIGNYSGNAGDSMAYHNGMLFSTKDRDNDMAYGKCAEEGRGGWWYNACSYSNPNVEYKSGADNWKYVHWWHWKNFVGLASIEIKLKPVRN